MCSRDPVDVVASYRKRLQKSRAEGMPESSVKWLNKTPDEMLDVFRRFTKLVQAARPAHGGDMFMAPYEWLVAAPETALREVCAFAGLRYDPAMLQAKDDEVPDPDAEDVPDAVSTVAASSQITQRQSDAHKVLTPAEIELVTQGTREWMDLWRQPGALN